MLIVLIGGHLTITLGQTRKRTASPEAVTTVNQNIVTGTDTGSSQVKRFDTPALTETASFLAFSALFTGGVRVAVGDVNGDGVADIICGAGPGGGPEVKVFDGVSGAVIRDFFAYSAGFTGGIFVAAGDINGDGKADIITGTDSGVQAEVKVFDSTSLAVLKDFFPFATFTGGARVAAGKVTADGVPDIVVGAGVGAGPEVKVFDGMTGAVILDFFAYNPAFTGGVYVAAGDLNNDLRADILTGAGAGGAPQVSVFSGANGALLNSFLAFSPLFTGGVRVAAGRVNADSVPDIIVGAGPGGGPEVKAYDGATGVLIHDFFAYDVTFTGGVFVAAPPIAVPSAAAVSVSGRVLTPDGRGLRNAVVTLNDQKGIARQVTTSSFGYYRFNEVQTGETYIISVKSKLYRFAPRLVTVSDALTDVDFIGLE